MAFMLGGLQAYAVESEELRAAIRDDARQPSTYVFNRFYPQELWKEAVLELRKTLEGGGEVSELASCAFCELAATTGTDAGFIKVPAEVGEEFAPFAKTWFPQILDDPDAGDVLLRGGWRGIVGTQRFAFGTLSPAHITAHDWEDFEFSDADSKALVEGGSHFPDWAEMFVDIVARAAGEPRKDVLFIPHWIDVWDADAPYEDRPPGERPTVPSTAGHSLLELLSTAIARKASDLLLTANVPPTLRIAGELAPQGDRALTRDDVSAVIRPILTDAQLAQFERELTLRFSFGVKDLGRFRVALFHQRGCVAVSVRILPIAPLELSALGLPAGTVGELARISRGLIVIAGAAGSGRTTTAHAILDRHNEAHRHLLTIEDPIELVHMNKGGIVTQIELRTDAATFAAALAVARQSDANVVLIDGLDDPDRLRGAVELANGGRLVTTTISAPSAAAARERVREAHDVVVMHQTRQGGQIKAELSGIA